MPPEPDTTPTPRADLELALRGGRSLMGRVLTRGEGVVVDAWFSLPLPARALYARLFSRVDRMVRSEGLADAYPEVPDGPAAVHTLSEAGFAWVSPQHPVPVGWRLPLYDRPELVQICRHLSLSARGRRAALEQRILDHGPTALATLDRPGIRLRHRGLLRRLCRAFLGRPDGDLRALVLQRMGTVRFARYTPTGGAGLFPDRRTLRAFEQARARAHTLLDQPALTPAHIAHALAGLRTGPVHAPEFRRFRAARYDVRIATAAADAFERSKAPAEAAPIWDALARSGHPISAHAARRWALCQDKLGKPGVGAARCAAARPTAPADERLSLDRTGRRLARKARTSWRPSPPLRPAAVRRLTLDAPASDGPRPLWSGEVVEEAVARALTATGRRVVRSENLLWTTLFGLLLRDVVFAEVPGMLPGTLQMAPLDLGLPSFAERRRSLLDAALDEIRADAGVARLHHAFTHHMGEAIRGVRWAAWSPADLEAVLTGIGGTVVAGVLDALACGAARSGLPDLWVLEGPAVRVPGLFPGRLAPGGLAIEVKGPSDSLRDGQRVWLDRLLRMDAAAEVWEVRSPR